MPIKVTLKQNKSVVSSINVGQKPSLALGQLINVDATNPDDGESLVYDAEQNKFIVKELTVNANNIPNIIGGTF